MPNPAFLRARADDLFWGARRVMAFTDEMIGAAVASASYRDERAALLVANTLIARRDLIGRAWLTGVNPIVDPSFDGTVLSFRNAAVDARVAPSPGGYRATWFSFDNATGVIEDLGETTTPIEQARSPEAASLTGASFLRVDVAAVGEAPESWTVPVRMYFRRNGDGWRLVGLDRQPDPPIESGKRASRSG